MTSIASPAAGLGFTADQLRLLLVVAVPLTVGPAIVVAHHARTSDHVDHWLAWTLLVLVTSLIGLVAYWEHHVIQEKRDGGNGEGPSDGSEP